MSPLEWWYRIVNKIMKYLKTFENHDRIEIGKSGGVYCDNPSCDWSDEAVNMTDSDKYLNKPCPKCGEIVLTQEDLNKSKKLMDAINLINSMSPEEFEKLSALQDELSDDDIIDAYLKLKDLGLKQSEEDIESWTFDTHPNTKKK